MKILLVALNTRYIHTNLAVRSLKACLSDAHDVCILEQDMQAPFEKLVPATLTADLLGLSCYIWNTAAMLRLAHIAKTLNPTLRVVLGGPEATFRADGLIKLPYVDVVVRGEGEVVFPQLVEALACDNPIPRLQGLVSGDWTGEDAGIAYVSDLSRLPNPYLGELPGAGQMLYYETSRGCPFHCAYCLSQALPGGVRFLPLDRVIRELTALSTCTPLIKLVDRTFNADNVRAAELVSALSQLPGNTCFHLELAGDRMSGALADALLAAPKGRFQLEIGVQSTNPKVLDAVGRQSDLCRLRETVSLLRQTDNQHIHLDLIAGLPFEDFESLRRSLEWTMNLVPHMMQLGFLKVLPGTAMKALAKEYVYADEPPYEVYQTPWLSAVEMARLRRVADALDAFYNDGWLVATMRYLRSVFPDWMALLEAMGETPRLSPVEKIAHIVQCMEGRTFINKILLMDCLRFDWMCKYKLAPPDFLGGEMAEANSYLNQLDLPATTPAQRRRNCRIGIFNWNLLMYSRGEPLNCGRFVVFFDFITPAPPRNLTDF